MHQDTHIQLIIIKKAVSILYFAKSNNTTDFVVTITCHTTKAVHPSREGYGFQKM